MSAYNYSDMGKKYIRGTLASIIVVVTVILFVRYFQTHPSYWQMLRHISPWTVVWILLLNSLMIVVLTLICEATVRLCGKSLKFKENFLLTSYSSIANFFGPLQSGPGVRAVYLKTKHRVRLRDYTLASLVALGLFALYNALFLFIGMRPWPQTVGALVIVSVITFVVIKLFIKRDKNSSDSHFALRGKVLAALVILVFLQAAITVGWYYVEIHAVNPSIHFNQVVSYTGAANFSLFVSITPDAVGIREAFLIFSQNIHHVPTSTIVAANVIDRAVYIMFLGLLFLLVLGMHGKERLHLRSKRD